MTKPGNSDPADRPAESKEPEPAEAPPDNEPTDSAEPDSPTADSPTTDGEKPGTTDSAPENGNAEPAAKPEPAAKAEPEPDPEPLMAELEKAPPFRDEPVMPTAAEARRRGDLPRPTVLRVAFYLALASGVVGLFSSIDLFLNKAELVEGAQSVDTPKPLTAAEAERAVTSLLWLYLVVVLALGAFLLLFAYKAQDGVRRSRMMAMIITLILVLFHFYFFGTVYGQISGLCAALMLAMLYLPSTREYFGPRQTAR